MIDEHALGFRVADEGRLFLTAAGGTQILDAVRVKNRPLARRAGATPQDRFFTPEAFTPGAPNIFAFEDAIVINEVMYHHRPQLEREAIGSLQLVEISPFNVEWRFNQSGANLGAIVYVNGTEVGRHQMPEGPVNATTLSSGTPDLDATLQGPQQWRRDPHRELRADRRYSRPVRTAAGFLELVEIETRGCPRGAGLPCAVMWPRFWARKAGQSG